MRRRWLTAGAMVCAVGAIALAPLPAQSSAPAPAPEAPSFEGDFVIPPDEAPRTRMPGATTRGSTSYKNGVYDVHVLAVDTADGPAPWDEAEARRQVEAMDAWYSSETEGGFRFRLAGYQLLAPYSGQLCGLDDALAHAKAEISRLRRTPGAIDVLPVVVGRWPEDCSIAGQAWLGSPGAWVTSDNPDDGNAFSTLIHEIGHNLGLVHSAAIATSSISEPWPSETTPEFEEYGDASDVMGWGGQYACTYTACVFNPSGMHGHNRNLLGALTEDDVIAIPMSRDDTSGTVVDLVAEESGASGPSVAYLPWRNRSKFFIEYRPAVGNDAHIADPYGPGSGVMVRVIGSDLDGGPDPYPEQDVDSPGTLALPAGLTPDVYSNIPIGFGVGAGTLLPDGSRVQVTAFAPDRATIRVTRPLDTTPPTMTAPDIDWGTGSCRSFPCTVPKSVAKSGKYRIWVGYGRFDDDQWVSYAVVSAKGKEIVGDERAAPNGLDVETAFSHGSRGWGRYVKFKPGTYSFDYTFGDISGNEVTQTYRVTLPKIKKK